MQSLCNKHILRDRVLLPRAPLFNAYHGSTNGRTRTPECVLQLLDCKQVDIRSCVVFGVDYYCNVVAMSKAIIMLT